MVLLQMLWNIMIPRLQYVLVNSMYSSLKLVNDHGFISLWLFVSKMGKVRANVYMFYEVIYGHSKGVHVL
jgi:hypothetical protein